MRAKCFLVALVLSVGVPSMAADPTEDLTPARRQELEKKAADLNLEVVRQYQAGNFVKGIELCREDLAIQRVLYPKQQFPNGHHDLAVSIYNLGELHRCAGMVNKAEPFLREALDMRRALYPRAQYPDGHHELVLTLNKLGKVHQATGEFGKAELLYREALAMCRALYPKAKYPDGNAELAESIDNLAVLHLAAGEYSKAEPLFREALDINRALYPKEKYPDGNFLLARSINNLGALYWFAKEYGKAEPLMREGLEMERAVFPKVKFPEGHADLAQSLSNLGMLHRDKKEFGKAEPLLREALEMYRSLLPKAQYPYEHLQLANSLDKLATVHQANKDYGKAEPLYREALQMRRTLYPKAKYPDGHRDVGFSLTNLGGLYQDAGEYGKAEPLLREALEMTRVLYPKAQYPEGHADLANSLSNLGTLHWNTGEYGKAEPLLREAIAMKLALDPKAQYPNIQADLATSLNNLGLLHLYAGEYNKALHPLRAALGIERALYPKDKYPEGHPDLARSLNNLALLFEKTGDYGKAELLSEEALVMNRALYPTAQFPNGNPDFAVNLDNLGLLRMYWGRDSEAEPLLREALEMKRALFPKALYPDGHPSPAISLLNLGLLQLYAGEDGKAEPLFREALGMDRALLRRYADLAAEAEALNYMTSQPLSRDIFLSVTCDRANAVAAYDELWDSRALVTRLQEQRHRYLAATGDPALRDLADQLQLARLSPSHRLLRPLKDTEDNRAEIRRLTNAKEDLEKRLASQMKLPALQPTEAPAPQDLASRLPTGSCFIDIYRYTHFAHDPNVKGRKGEKRTPTYVAFVVRPGKGTARVELGDADAIERARTDWRKAITATPPDEAAERKAAAAVARLVWEPLRPELPADCTTVYLTADAALHQLPWVALPGAKTGTVLLEEHAICRVPHGPFLLQRLEERPPRTEAAARLLAMGGIDYQDRAASTDAPSPITLREPALAAGGVRWAALAGTAKERQQVAALASQTGHLEVIERAGKKATTEQFQHDLPGVRYAHVATHGFFADPQFRSALQIDPKEFGALDVLDRRGGARSPLTLSGLVFAGANRSGNEAAEDRGIVTAEGLIGLRLEGLELAVLSACETGLGEAGGGEGVYGLQRAFHVAGCRDVVASLWKVDDDATQALMALFYRNLWEGRMDPAEALRQAQLTLYRTPSAVAGAGKRADFTERDLPKNAVAPAKAGQHAPTAQWAAFTFSGVRPVSKAGD